MWRRDDMLFLLDFLLVILAVVVPVAVQTWIAAAAQNRHIHIMILDLAYTQPNQKEESNIYNAYIE